MAQLQTIGPRLTFSRPLARSAPPAAKPQAPPVESFEPSLELPLAAAAPTRSRGLGKTALLVGLGLAVGVIGTIAITNPPEPTVPAPTTRAEQRAVRYLETLQTIADSDGGHFEVDHPFLPIRVKAKSTEQVYGRLKSGQSVYYQRFVEQKPSEIRDFNDLRDTTLRVVRDKLVDGLGDLSRDLERELRAILADLLSGILDPEAVRR
ncbi:MAG: hypothetical protein AB7S38_02085 [Vulcanimicrobiota bacterium]